MKTKYTLAAAFALLAFPASLTAGTTVTRTTVIIANPGGPSNGAIPQGFGDRVTSSSSGNYNNAFSVTGGGTPHIELAWSAIDNVNGSVTRWEFHNWDHSVTADGGVLQLNGSDGATGTVGDEDPFVTNDVHQITFTPDAGYATIINGFNFIGDTNGDTYQYNWRVLENQHVVASGQTDPWSTDHTQVGRPTWDGAPNVNINYEGGLGSELILEIAQSIGSTGNGVNIAIDNLSFSQAQAVPEPSSAALLGLGGLALLLRRRK